MTHPVPAVTEILDHSIGRPDAPVTLIEYGDYECPYCGEAFPVLKAVQRALGGDLLFVFRNFPLTEVHPHAGRAAEFAEGAASVGQFWAGARYALSKSGRARRSKPGRLWAKAPN